MKFAKLLFGPAGIPHSTSKPVNSENGVKTVRKLGLDAMEFSFGPGVYLKEEACASIQETAKKNEVVLSAHGPYYINFNAVEDKKLYASHGYIHKAAKIVDLCGGHSVAFHAAYYMKMPTATVYNNVKKQLKELVKKLKDEGNKVLLRPELTGKPTQWGDLNEIIKIGQELDQVLPCIDFGHLHAREGRYNTYKEIRGALEALEKGLGREILDNMHIQIAGIEYTEKGERRHLNLDDSGSDLNYKDIVKVWKEFRIKGVVITETPNQEDDALKLKKMWER